MLLSELFAHPGFRVWFALHALFVYHGNTCYPRLAKDNTPLLGKQAALTGHQGFVADHPGQPSRRILMFVHACLLVALMLGARVLHPCTWYLGSTFTSFSVQTRAVHIPVWADLGHHWLNEFE